MAVPEIVTNKDSCTLGRYKVQRASFYLLLIATVTIGYTLSRTFNTFVPEILATWIPSVQSGFNNNVWVAAINEEVNARLLPGLVIPTLFAWYHRKEEVCFDIRDTALRAGLIGGALFGFFEFYLRLTDGMLVADQLTFYPEMLAPFLLLHTLNGIIVLGGTLRVTGDDDIAIRDVVTILSVLAIGIGIHWIWNTWWVRQDWFWNEWIKIWTDLFQMVGINL